MLPKGLPSNLVSLIDGYQSERFSYYESNAIIFRLWKDSDVLYLKIVNPASYLNQEYQILKWIDGRLPVPKPLYYDRVDLTEYLLTTQVEGIPVYQLGIGERENSVRILANTLKIIHELDPAGCPFLKSIDRLLQAGYREYPERSDLVDKLEDNKPDEDFKFTHGDYCLPNILVNDGSLGGVIDWDCAGVGDPYRDYVACIWSLRRNFGEKAADEIWIPLFLQELGVELNPDKLDYFMTIWNEL